MSHKMRTVHCIFDTEGSPNFIREDFSEADRLRSIWAVKWPSLQIEADQKVGTVGTALLHIRMGDAGIGVIFRVVRNLVVIMLRGSAFIARFVKGSFLLEHKNMLYNSARVPTNAPVINTGPEYRRDKQEGNTAETVTVGEGVQNTLRPIRVARQTTIPPKLNGVVLATKEATGLNEVDVLSEKDFKHA